MRTVVVKNSAYGRGEGHKVSCLQMNKPLAYYHKRHQVVAIVNKLANPYHIFRIQAYYQDREI